MGLIINGQKMAKPLINGVPHNCFINGQKIWKDEGGFADYLTNMLFALDYHDVIYEGNTFSGIVDSSGYNNQGFTYYNMSRVSKAADGSMLWGKAADSYSTIKINGLKDSNFTNGMTVISMYKPIYNGYSHMNIGTPGHNNESQYQYHQNYNTSGNLSIGLNRYPSSGDYISQNNIQFSTLGNRYNVMASIFNPATTNAAYYAYLKSGNNITRQYYNTGTVRGSFNTGLEITIGASHANDGDLNSVRSVWGITSQVKYVFFFNEVFNQTKIENFIKDVLINEF